MNYADYLNIKNLENQANKYGFKIGRYKYADSYTHSNNIALDLVDNNWPVYSRDYQPMTGSAQDLTVFLAGIEWYKQYLNMLKIDIDKLVDRKEKDYNNRKLMDTMKDD